jgi:hypothetical protein
MKNIWMALLFLMACSSKPAMPEAPTTLEATTKMLTGKNWVAVKVGILSPFQTEGKSSYDWLDDMKEPDEFIKTTLNEMAGLQFKFVSDTLANVSGVKDAPAEQKYAVAAGEEDDASKVKLEFTYEGPDFFDNTKKSVMTYSYPVLGISDKALILATPRSVNDRRVVVMMEVK